MNKFAHEEANYFEESIFLKSPIGCLRLKLLDDLLVSVEFDCEFQQTASPSKTAIELARQLDCYFDSQEFAFCVDVKTSGTEFQQKVWRALMDIPSGSIVTYGQLAKQLNSSARAIGNACRRNPVPIIIPCHRVVAASDIGGFSGQKKGKLLNIKRYLLKHEGHSF